MGTLIGLLFLILVLAAMFWVVRSWDDIRTQIGVLFAPSRIIPMPPDDHPLLSPPRAKPVQQRLDQPRIQRVKRGHWPKRHTSLPHQARHR
jgi:hypothetical protein